MPQRHQHRTPHRWPAAHHPHKLVPRHSSSARHLRQHPLATDRKLQYVDSSQNGLWKLNTDGTGLTRLTTEVKGNVTSLCQFSQNPWSNVSRDDSLYAFETNNTGTYPYTYTLSFGQFSGSSPQSFASISDGTQLAIIGWTTM